LKLTLTAFRKSPTSTLSQLSIDGTFFCYVLEDADRGLTSDMHITDILRIKQPHATAIPSGTYQVIMNWSARFNTYLPLLLDVPGYYGIRIHAGNTTDDTDGCLLVGQWNESTRDEVRSTNEMNNITQSRATLKRLIAILSKAGKKGNVTIQITR
jgi:hypothetical protein